MSEHKLGRERLAAHLADSSQDDLAAVLRALDGGHSGPSGSRGEAFLARVLMFQGASLLALGGLLTSTYASTGERININAKAVDCHVEFDPDELPEIASGTRMNIINRSDPEVMTVKQEAGPDIEELPETSQRAAEFALKNSGEYTIEVQIGRCTSTWTFNVIE